MNRHRDDKTRYGWPPLRDAPFPAEVPWDTHIHLLSDFWIERYCAHCDAGGPSPLRLFAAEHGWFLTLRSVVPRLKCKRCGRRFTRIELCSDGAGDAGRYGAKSQWLDMTGGPGSAQSSGREGERKVH